MKKTLTDRTKKLLYMQGFSMQDVENNPHILALSKWTPLACAIFGSTGIVLVLFCNFIAPYYFIALGLLTLIGAVRPYSFYDYLYNYVFRYIFKFGKMPAHGAQRKFGCGIGGIMYAISGVGFFLENMYLAYIPAIFMVVFAFVAGLSNWCFASTVHALICGKKDEK